MTKIKIFVSHRIDRIAKTIDNDLFIPVRCGAVYDEEKNIKMLGDNTGENISEKRNSFCELTVLYWAWKNQKADYYGLCHYRRYLSFSDDVNELSKTEHDQGCLSIPEITDNTIKKYNLISSVMQKEIKKYDAIFMKPINLKELGINSNYEAMKNSPDYHNIKDVDKMLQIIKEKYPNMYETAWNYMYKSNISYLYNCFIMKASIFNDFCKWLFDILFDLEKQIDMSYYNRQQYRALGTIGERLLGIYITWLQKQNKYKIKNTPLLFVQDTDIEDDILPAFVQNNIPIVSNFNDKYAPIFSVFLSSVIAHASSNYNYDFIILSDNISESHKNLLKNMLKKNMTIRFLSAKRYLSSIDLFVKHQVYSIDLYYRVIIPQILKYYDKLIVVDADMICREDIANLYKENIQSYLAGGCIDCVFQGYLNGADPNSKPYVLDYMNMDNPYQYINTGLLIFNAKKYRSMYSISFLKSYINTHISNVRIYEQDMLNMLLYKKVKFLNIKWNLETKSNEFIKKCFTLCPLQTILKYESARESSDIGIIHYAGYPKPWLCVNVDFSDIWWSYARKSPFYEEILANMLDFKIAQNESMISSNLPQLRNEFSQIHFPNINNHFAANEREMKLLFVMKHMWRFKLKKFYYRLKMAFSFGDRYRKYAQKYNNAKSLIKDARNFKKSLFEV